MSIFERKGSIVSVNSKVADCDECPCIGEKTENLCLIYYSVLTVGEYMPTIDDEWAISHIYSVVAGVQGAPSGCGAYSQPTVVGPFTFDEAYDEIAKTPEGGKLTVTQFRESLNNGEAYYALGEKSDKGVDVVAVASMGVFDTYSQEACCSTSKVVSLEGIGNWCCSYDCPPGWEFRKALKSGGERATSITYHIDVGSNFDFPQQVTINVNGSDVPEPTYTIHYIEGTYHGEVVPDADETTENKIVLKQTKAKYPATLSELEPWSPGEYDCADSPIVTSTIDLTNVEMHKEGVSERGVLYLVSDVLCSMDSNMVQLYYRTSYSPSSGLVTFDASGLQTVAYYYGSGSPVYERAFSVWQDSAGNLWTSFDIYVLTHPDELQNYYFYLSGSVSWSAPICAIIAPNYDGQSGIEVVVDTSGFEFPWTACHGCVQPTEASTCCGCKDDDPTAGEPYGIKVNGKSYGIDSAGAATECEYRGRDRSQLECLCGVTKAGEEPGVCIKCDGVTGVSCPSQQTGSVSLCDFAIFQQRNMTAASMLSSLPEDLR